MLEEDVKPWARRYLRFQPGPPWSTLNTQCPDGKAFQRVPQNLKKQWQQVPGVQNVQHFEIFLMSLQLVSRQSPDDCSYFQHQ